MSARHKTIGELGRLAYSMAKLSPPSTKYVHSETLAPQYSMISQISAYHESPVCLSSEVVVGQAVLEDEIRPYRSNATSRNYAWLSAGVVGLGHNFTPF
jgi:hypothetical protein